MNLKKATRIGRKDFIAYFLAFLFVAGFILSMVDPGFKPANTLLVMNLMFLAWVYFFCIRRAVTTGLNPWWVLLCWFIPFVLFGSMVPVVVILLPIVLSVLPDKVADQNNKSNTNNE